MGQVVEFSEWSARAASDPEIVALRRRLDAENGIKGLEILEPGDLRHAVELFRRDGFVVIADVLNSEQTEILARGCHEVISDIFESPDFVLRAASGDFCLPGAVDYQPLHSDVRDWRSATTTPFSAFHDPRGELSIYDLPCPYVCVNFLPQAVTRLNGPTRQVPGTQHSRTPIPDLVSEPEWMRLSTVCPAPAGAIMVRDVRAWHGGTPNVSDAARSIPNLEFYAPWFREPIVPGITYDAYRSLSERAQRIVRPCLADSSETLLTGAPLRAP